MNLRDGRNPTEFAETLEKDLWLFAMLDSSQNISGKENSCISCHGELDWSQVANQSYLNILKHFTAK